MGVELSRTRWERLDAVFADADRDRARALLVPRCGDGLPLWGDATPIGLERIRFAVLKLTCGDLDRRRDAIARARSDWRDVLVEAGFAERVDAHLHWLPVPGRP